MYKILHKKEQDNSSKINTHDLREIIYKANDYNRADEPVISEKEINLKLADKNISIEE